MDKQTKVAGVILAGGLARRMDNQDKGLMDFHGQPLVSYAVAAMAVVAGNHLFISANRNIERYQEWGISVIKDVTDSFDGPLAGVLAAMRCTDADILLVMPCDSPLVKGEHLQKLLSACINTAAEVAIAVDGERWHPVFLAVRTSLQGSLSCYLSSGRHKLQDWLKQCQFVLVDFRDEQEIFANINTFAELKLLEAGE